MLEKDKDEDKENKFALARDDYLTKIKTKKINLLLPGTVA